MGADVAASPHCPFAGALPCGDSQAPGSFEGRSGPNRGFRRLSLRDPFEACASTGFPAGSPSGPKPWRFAARQISDLRPCSRSRRCRKPKPRIRLVAGSSAEASVPPVAVHGSGSWVLPGSQLPGRSPVLPDNLARPVCRWQRADFRPAFAGQVWTCVLACLSVFQTGVRRTVGRFSKPAAFASAKGQARSFRLAAASSAALPLLSARCLVRQGPAAPAVAGKATVPLPEDRLGHGLKLPFNPSRSKRNLPVDNEDNGHNLRPRNVSGTAANREAKSPAAADPGAANARLAADAAPA